jgi:uncharacterized protein YdcH (DUF465 family)
MNMNKFVQTLSASDASIKESRARILSEQTEIEASTMVQNLKKEKLQLQSKINQMTDLAPETTDSLRPGTKGFDASKWIKDLHTFKMQLKLKQIELDEAESIYNEWFGIAEDEAETKATSKKK